MSRTIASRSESVLLNNYGRLPIAMVKGEGSTLWDESGRQYIDLFAGFGATGIVGHSHPRVAAVIAEQARLLQCHGNLFTNEAQVALAEQILENSFQGKVFFCHSGAESNEAALKLVRKRDASRPKVISFENCFHGRTYGALSLTPESFQAGCGEMLPGNLKVPYGDFQALKDCVDETVGAVWMEPIQGEGGINVPDVSFVQKVRAYCDERDLLLVMDEVWTAPARTGKWFAYQHYGIVPDIMSLGKAVGGGTPLAASVIAEKHSHILGPGSHGCTMGGNPLCSAAALTALQLISEERLLVKAEEIFTIISETVAAASLPSLQGIRGKGAMVGLSLADDIDNKKVMMSCLERGLNVCIGKGNIIRLAPSLTITHAELEKGLLILVSVLNNF